MKKTAISEPESCKEDRATGFSEKEQLGEDRMERSGSLSSPAGMQGVIRGSVFTCSPTN